MNEKKQNTMLKKGLFYTLLGIFLVFGNLSVSYAMEEINIDKNSSVYEIYKHNIEVHKNNLSSKAAIEYYLQSTSNIREKELLTKGIVQILLIP